MHSSEVTSPVVLVGAPNSGKTTLYNWLTNSRYRTVNYPGATVEYAIGQLAVQWGGGFSVVDTPGTYSLIPKGEDEQVTKNVLYKMPEHGFAKRCVVAVDGTLLDRHLLLVDQMREAGFSVVVAITMTDLLRREKIILNTKVLSEYFACPVVAIDGVLGGGLRELVECIRSLPESAGVTEIQSWSSDKLKKKTTEFKKLTKEFLGSASAESEKQLSKIFERTQKVDRFLLNPFFGVIFFIAVMTLLFSSIYWFATPFMDGIESGLSVLSDYMSGLLGEGLLSDFVNNGLIAGVGSVVVFVPQIFILFLGIGFLESSGYLTRAATLVDKPFSWLGMGGRSFVPVLSGFACAVPALMATRNISSARDRWITNFIIPLMTCSARLPVYALLLVFIFPDNALKAGVALTGLYFFALLTGVIAAGVLNKILKKSGTSLFMMELPLYRLPKFKVLLFQTLDRTKSFLKRAGPVIFVLSVFIWLGSTFPNYQLQGNERFQTSYLAKAGQAIEPVFSPMGVDWRVGVGMISAFAAREVFVSTMAIVFNIEGEDEAAQEQGLLSAMTSATTASGRPVFTVASVVGLLIFFSIALQCMSTFAVAIKEGGSAKFAWTQLIVFNLAAYLLAVLAYQILNLLGF